MAGGGGDEVDYDDDLDVGSNLAEEDIMVRTFADFQNQEQEDEIDGSPLKATYNPKTPFAHCFIRTSRCQIKWLGADSLN